MASVNNATVRGKQNRAAGALFEQMIDAACLYYRQYGIAEIEKTPEAMKPLGHHDSKGRFLACYAKKAQPDFKGTLKGGRSVVFEAKITTTGKIQQSVVLDQQAAALDRHDKLRACCFILVSFDFQKFYYIPWAIWKNMKRFFGRKYLQPEDIPEFEVKIRHGVLDFLGEIK